MRSRALFNAPAGPSSIVQSRRDILAEIVLALAAPMIATASAIARPSYSMNSGHLKADSTIGDLLRHPALAGFARRLLPWDERPVDETLLLSAYQALAPYHTHIDTGATLDGLNRLIDEGSAGRQVFHDIYDDDAKRRDPAKAHTGLFFYRGRPGAPFAIVAPGGGFAYVASMHEGLPYALAISRAGYNAFVLKYRAGKGGGVATEDLAAALTYVMRNAAALEVGTSGYSLWGSSAGARMAAAIGSHGAARFGGADLPKPTAVVLAYTAHSDIAATEPPTFVVVGERDGISPPAAMERRLEALRHMGVATQYRRIEGIGHGFGPGIGTPAEGWLADAIAFWRQHQLR